MCTAVEQYDVRAVQRRYADERVCLLTPFRDRAHRFQLQPLLVSLSVPSPVGAVRRDGVLCQPPWVYVGVHKRRERQRAI